VLQTIIDHLRLGVTLIDAQLNMIAYNDEFLRLLEFPPGLVEGSEPTFGTFIRYNAERGEYGSGDTDELVQRIVERASRMEPHMIERTRPNGTVIEIRGMPLPGGGFITIYTDITESKRTEEELRRVREELEELAAQDPLTGVANQRKFTERFEHEMARAARNGMPLSVLMIDIDHFKAINDRHGHLAGDACLKMLAVLLQDCVRGADLVARFGGEEFVVLLPDTPADKALLVAERMRRETEARSVPTEGTSPVQITISVGAATTGEGAQSFDQLVGRADEAVYRAKRAGRNQTCA
jgi:diguanylate cyclase (GGDEF)-like protein